MVDAVGLDAKVKTVGESAKGLADGHMADRGGFLSGIIGVIRGYIFRFHFFNSRSKAPRSGGGHRQNLLYSPLARKFPVCV